LKSWGRAGSAVFETLLDRFPRNTGSEQELDLLLEPTVIDVAGLGLDGGDVLFLLGWSARSFRSASESSRFIAGD
jgi:hypothetical protein